MQVLGRQLAGPVQINMDPARQPNLIRVRLNSVGPNGAPFQLSVMLKALCLLCGLCTGRHCDGDQRFQRLRGSGGGKQARARVDRAESHMVLAAIIAVAMEFVPHGSLLGIAGLFLCGFFVFGPASSFWALCPDIFGRRLSVSSTSYHMHVRGLGSLL